MACCVLWGFSPYIVNDLLPTLMALKKDSPVKSNSLLSSNTDGYCSVYDAAYLFGFNGMEISSETDRSTQHTSDPLAAQHSRERGMICLISSSTHQDLLGFQNLGGLFLEAVS